MSISVKVAMLGQSTVGKTCIVHRFLNSRFGNEELTVGVSFSTKIINLKNGKKVVKLYIWDTAGQEKYRSLASMYYKEVDAAIIVYDITSKESFEGVRYWIGELHESGPSNVVIYIVGNKSDLMNSSEVPLSEAESLAKSINAIFRQTSAKENIGINDLFYDICLDVINSHESNSKQSLENSEVQQINKENDTKIIPSMQLKEEKLKTGNNCCSSKN